MTEVAKPWLDRYESGVPQSIDYQDITIPQYVHNSIENYPDRAALIFQGYELNYRAMGQMIDRMATALHGFGVSKGDRVAILLPNLIPCVVACQAALKIGALLPCTAATVAALGASPSPLRRRRTWTTSTRCSERPCWVRTSSTPWRTCP